MPTYEYECAKCKKVSDVVQSMRDAPITKCPLCGGKVKRLLGTGAGIIFKGSGFYQTDYRNSSYQSAAKADSASAASSSATSTPAASTPAASTPAAPAKSEPAAKSGGGKKGA